MKRALLTSALLVAGLGVAVPVFAQGGPQPGGPGPGMGPGHDRHFARMCEDQEARLAGRLAYAEKKLNITEQQRAAWTKFADAARSSLKPTQDLCVKFKDVPPPPALPQRLERAEQMMQAHLQQLQTVRPALTDLYAQLTPDQQRQADHMLNQGPGGMGGRMGPHHGGPGGWDHDGPRHHGMGPGKGPGPGPAPAPQEPPKG
ncbi:Spy/CpxP family protein refolding chaperone [Azospirillum sp. YIM B02556]|uniref:Spy/CpxP family protein refolding chaperone n=1 Tax=Azospirillum endophyticum TaxID=2800326 RepID=A0ABS1FF97_9PROT|nr:Spy/CpxP family protein refolding chaperone [Azospirillum endophyticum]MBK1842070.1 Spy/CpxP family protein refolding chaperone [Azospirillum endophyticum]